MLKTAEFEMKKNYVVWFKRTPPPPMAITEVTPAAISAVAKLNSFVAEPNCLAASVSKFAFLTLSVIAVLYAIPPPK